MEVFRDTFEIILHLENTAEDKEKFGASDYFTSSHRFQGLQMGMTQSYDVKNNLVYLGL